MNTPQPTNPMPPSTTVQPPTTQPQAPTTQTVDKNLFAQPGETYAQYETRVAPQYQTKEPTQTDTTKTTSTNPLTPPDTTEQNKTISYAQQQLDQATADYQTQAKKVQDTITNISNGITPLTADQQAQVDGLKSQFDTLVTAQQQQNSAATGTAQIRGYQTGAAEYDNSFQVKTIGAIVTAGATKVAKLQADEAAAIGNLTEGFKQNDIKAIQDAWTVYQDAAKNRQDALNKTITDTQNAISQQQAEYDKQQQYQLDVQKFQQTQDQNAFDNAFKVEQEKFAEQKDAAAQAETVRHDKATEAIQAFTAGMGAGGGNGGLAPIQSAQMGATGTPDAASQQQVLAQIAQQYGPMTATAIQGLANYTINPADWSTRMVKGGNGMTRQQAVTLAKAYDPTYNDANYAVRASYLKSLASNQTGTVGSAINSANKAVNHLTAFVTTMNQLGNKEFDPANALFNSKFIATPAKKQQINAAQTEGLGVAEELAKFFKGSGTVDVASIDAWKSQVNTSLSPSEVKGVTQGAITLLSGQLETLAEQYQTTMGKAPETDFLNPSARASLSSLKNQGYEVNIPGIYYTDVKAYQAADPSASANMKTAYQALQSAGLPTTPENILQMAQSL